MTTWTGKYCVESSPQAGLGIFSSLVSFVPLQANEGENTTRIHVTTHDQLQR